MAPLSVAATYSLQRSAYPSAKERSRKAQARAREVVLAQRPPATARRVLWAKLAGVTHERELRWRTDGDSMPADSWRGRLASELLALKKLEPEVRDWRRVPAGRLRALWIRGEAGSAQDRAVLSSAVFVGTAQACLEGSYWVEVAGCEKVVSCGHLARPLSRLLAPLRPAEHLVRKALAAGCQAQEGTPRLHFRPRCHPLDAAVAFKAEAGAANPRVAVVHFTDSQDVRSCDARHVSCSQDPLLLRSTYAQALEKMESHIHVPLGEALEAGSLVHTPGVALLRGPLADGARWRETPEQVDVIWLAFPPNPMREEQEQYAYDEDRLAMHAAVDGLFAWAACSGVDALVLPPLALSNGCQHPSLDVADIIHETAQCYARCVSDVIVASDVPGHFSDATWWDAFSSAVASGRPAIRRPVPRDLPPYLRLRKTPRQRAEKVVKLHPPPPSKIRESFL